MLRKINIENFGSFKNFTWDAYVRDKGNNKQDFKKLNVIFGRNYSGKTTLSRIIRCLETGDLPKNFSEPKFSTEFNDGTFDEQNLEACSHHIRVYNSDFVRENLSFLHNPIDGVIQPFAILGSANIETEAAIEKITNKLGSVEDGSGLRSQVETENDKVKTTKKTYDEFHQELERKLTEHASKIIKKNPLFEEPTYNKNKLKADIEQVLQNKYSLLSQNELHSFTELLKESALPPINEKLTFYYDVENLSAKVDAAITRQIQPTAPLQKLLNDSVLQTWVREGMDIHRQKDSVSCEFCGNALPPDLWGKLEAHFNHASQALEQELNSVLVEIENAQQNCITLPNLDGSNFYSSMRNRYFELREKLREELDSYMKYLQELREKIKARISNIYSPLDNLNFEYQSFKLENLINELNELFREVNAQTDSLQNDKAEGRRKLKLDNVLQFATAIKYRSERAKEDKHEIAFETAKQLQENVSLQVKTLEDELRQLKTKISSEQKAVETVNGFLSHHFGHDNLRLDQVIDESEVVPRFKITRNNEPAYNLSDGEASLISICYFLARLADSSTDLKNTIVFIDDPISSLDTSHVFFVFGLIESVIAKRRDNELQYKQLFISTHNLDFLKYLKRLTLPNKNHSNFVIEKGESTSSIKLLPEYLDKYISEFNYLFEQIFICSDEKNASELHHSFYNFGNNLRKFLETFLFFKYPYLDNPENRMEKLEDFFGGDEISTALTIRIKNELSHLAQVIDRGMRPVDSGEISKLANFVIDKIFENDPKQLNALLRSINQPERTS